MPTDREEQDDMEAIQAIMDLFDVDEETAREMWKRFRKDVEDNTGGR